MISLRRAFSLVRYPLIRTTSTVQTSQLNLHCDGSAIHVSGPSIKSLSLPVPWLRDSCQCPRCVYPQTEHKLMHTGYFLTSIPSSISLQPDALAVSWSGPREENGHHDSLYPLSFLERYAESTGQIRRASQFEDVLARKPWDILSYPEPQFIEYQDFVRDPLPTFLRILKYGFVMFRGVPTEGTELGDVEGSTVQNLAEAFGVVRATRYGKMWDVVVDKAAPIIALTNSSLGLHMDLMQVICCCTYTQRLRIFPDSFKHLRVSNFCIVSRTKLKAVGPYSLTPSSRPTIYGIKTAKRLIYSPRRLSHSNLPASGITITKRTSLFNSRLSNHTLLKTHRPKLSILIILRRSKRRCL